MIQDVARQGVLLGIAQQVQEAAEELTLAPRPELRSFDEVLRSENVRRISILESANAILTISHVHGHELIRIWDLETKLLSRSYQTNIEVNCFNLSPDGTKLLLGAGTELLSLQVERIFGGRRLTAAGAYRLPRSSEPVDAVLFGADSSSFRAITANGEQHQISFGNLERIETALRLDPIGH